MKKKITIEAHLLQPGMTLADRRYRIDSLLGNNGIMVTYKGYDTFRKKVVVVRELFPTDIVERDRLHDYHLDCKKLSDEALFESMKEHVIGRAKKLIRMYPVEGIANVLTFLEERGTVYSIEEYVEGMTLDKYLLKRHSAKFTVEDLMKLLAPVMQTLAKLHQDGICHLALSPQQIMVLPDRKTVIVGFTNPMEDIAAPQLKDPGVRQDGYAPVELYLPEAKRSSKTDQYAMAAILYRYVTGEKLPAYYERINEEKESTPPQQMQTRIMDFQSEAIMKAASIYDFDRYEDLEAFRKTLLPADMDMDSLYSEQETTKTLKRKPFWYAYEQKKLHRYYAVIAALLLVAVIVLGPRLYQVGLDIRINHFYDKFNNASLYEQCQMLENLSKKQRQHYTNDYVDMDSTLTDEERSKAMEAKYYDFQLNKYVLYDKVDQSRTYYEYMKIDLRDGYAWVDYNSDTTNMHTEIRFPQEKDGSYYVQIETVDEKGNRKNETVYAKP